MRWAELRLESFGDRRGSREGGERWRKKEEAQMLWDRKRTMRAMGRTPRMVCKGMAQMKNINKQVFGDYGWKVVQIETVKADGMG